MLAMPAMALLEDKEVVSEPEIVESACKRLSTQISVSPFHVPCLVFSDCGNSLAGGDGGIGGGVGGGVGTDNVWAVSQVSIPGESDMSVFHTLTPLLSSNHSLDSP